LQGKYDVLVGASFSGLVTAAIAQTGLVPSGSRSVAFLTGPADRLQASFAGQLIPLVQIGAGANYIIVGGDVSQFAGQIGELRFTAPPSSGGLLDDIQFSPLPIPEPSIVSLLAVGVSVLGWRALSKQR
jgi:hypothetical protein